MSGLFATLTYLPAIAPVSRVITLGSVFVVSHDGLPKFRSKETSILGSGKGIFIYVSKTGGNTNQHGMTAGTGPRREFRI